MSTCMSCMDTGFTIKLGSLNECDCITDPRYVRSNPLVTAYDERTKPKTSKYFPLSWDSCGSTASRTKVLGGWIVRIYAYDKDSGGPVFVPDENHVWEV